MRSLGAEKFILRGLSMGGAIAIGYALKYPAQVELLVPVSHLDGVKELLPHGDTCILKGCKHWPVKERPEEFVRIIQSGVEKGGFGKRR